jgi:hypothetical protein
MSNLSFLPRPLRNLTDAVVMPFRAVFVVAITATINAATYSGVWWFKWVALGMGIAVLVSLVRAFKTLVVLGLVAWAGRKLWQRWGSALKG